MKTLLFAVAMCFGCSMLLTVASSGLQRFQEKNIILDKQKNLLQAAGLMQAGRDYDAMSVERLYRESIYRYWVGRDGGIVTEADRTPSDLPIYLYARNGQVLSYIVPIDSRGLWGRIKGYVAIESDGNTIAGFSIFNHSETPGLGGEIEKRWFRDNFIGKKIVDKSGGFVSITIAKGNVAAVSPEKRHHFVDGISGATMTGKFLTQGMKETLYNYEPVSIRFRGGLVRRVPGIPVPSSDGT